MADSLRVGLTSIEGTVTGPSGERATLAFLIDSGAKYTLLPHDAWKKLGLEPKWRMRFQMADGRIVERAISECHLALPERDGTTTVILGEPGDVALLGVVTLEQFGLVFYPFDRSLRRSEPSMLAATAALITKGGGFRHRLPFVRVAFSWSSPRTRRGSCAR